MGIEFDFNFMETSDVIFAIQFHLIHIHKTIELPTFSIVEC